MTGKGQRNRCYLAAFENGGRGSWVASGSEREKARKQVSPRASKKGGSPADTLILAQGDLCWCFELQNCEDNKFVVF